MSPALAYSVVPRQPSKPHFALGSLSIDHFVHSTVRSTSNQAEASENTFCTIDRPLVARGGLGANLLINLERGRGVYA